MSAKIVFISDIHLSTTQPLLTEMFTKYIQEQAPKLEELYILGDLFDSWIGFDNNSEYNSNIFTMLKTLAKTTKVFFMPGNRDFLLTQEIVEANNCTYLPDPSILNISGQKIYLTHGDLLCSNDKNYQVLRKVIQHQLTKKIFMQLPLKIRQVIANKTRKVSTKSNKNKKQIYFQIDNDKAKEIIKEHNINFIIHGHIHQSCTTVYPNNSKRVSLQDWRRDGYKIVTIADLL